MVKLNETEHGFESLRQADTEICELAWNATMTQDIGARSKVYEDLKRRALKKIIPENMKFRLENRIAKRHGYYFDPRFDYDWSYDEILSTMKTFQPEFDEEFAKKLPEKKIEAHNEREKNQLKHCSDKTSSDKLEEHENHSKVVGQTTANNNLAMSSIDVHAKHVNANIPTISKHECVAKDTSGSCVSSGNNTHLSTKVAKGKEIFKDSVHDEYLSLDEKLEPTIESQRLLLSPKNPCVKKGNSHPNHLIQDQLKMSKGSQTIQDDREEHQAILKKRKPVENKDASSQLLQSASIEEFLSEQGQCNKSSDTNGHIPCVTADSLNKKVQFIEDPNNNKGFSSNNEDLVKEKIEIQLLAPVKQEMSQKQNQMLQTEVLGIVPVKTIANKIGLERQVVKEEINNSEHHKFHSSCTKLCTKKKRCLNLEMEINPTEETLNCTDNRKVEFLIQKNKQCSVNGTKKESPIIIHSKHAIKSSMHEKTTIDLDMLMNMDRKPNVKMVIQFFKKTKEFILRDQNWVLDRRKNSISNRTHEFDLEKNNMDMESEKKKWIHGRY